MDEIKFKFCKKCGCDTERYANGGNCKPCARARTSAWREANPDRYAARRAEYREENRQKESERAAKWQRDNKEKAAAKHARWRAENREHLREVGRAWHKEWSAANPEKAAAKTSAWRKANPHLVNAQCAKRKAAKLRATPKWANQDAIKAIYAEAARIQRKTGVPHDVDHIVPLNSPIVCGLHCEANLEVLTKKDNIEKSNKYWPNMP